MDRGLNQWNSDPQTHDRSLENLVHDLEPYILNIKF